LPKPKVLFSSTWRGIHSNDGRRVTSTNRPPMARRCRLRRFRSRPGRRWSIAQGQDRPRQYSSMSVFLLGFSASRSVLPRCRKYQGKHAEPAAMECSGDQRYRDVLVRLRGRISRDDACALQRSGKSGTDGLLTRLRVFPAALDRAIFARVNYITGRTERDASAGIRRAEKIGWSRAALSVCRGRAR